MRPTLEKNGKNKKKKTLNMHMENTRIDFAADVAELGGVVGELDDLGGATAAKVHTQDERKQYVILWNEAKLCERYVSSRRYKVGNRGYLHEGPVCGHEDGTGRSRSPNRSQRNGEKMSQGKEQAIKSHQTPQTPTAKPFSETNEPRRQLTLNVPRG